MIGADLSRLPQGPELQLKPPDIRRSVHWLVVIQCVLLTWLCRRRIFCPVFLDIAADGWDRRLVPNVLFGGFTRAIVRLLGFNTEPCRIPKLTFSNVENVIHSLLPFVGALLLRYCSRFGATFFGTRSTPIRWARRVMVEHSKECSVMSICLPCASLLSIASARHATALNLRISCSFASDKQSAPPASTAT